MNTWTDNSSAINYYYDGDFPSEFDRRYPENFDATTISQGLRYDVFRYLELAQPVADSILELCCGTGRVAIPLAAAGHSVVAVDYSDNLMDQFRAKLSSEDPDTKDRLQLVKQDITSLELPQREFPLSIIAFNSLLCLTSFEDQSKALGSCSDHLATGGLLALDIVNPLRLDIDGDPIAKPFFSRRNPHNGRKYTRFASVGPFDSDHCQTLYGWYDELDDAGAITRRNYSVVWRPIFRYELALMLEKAGFEIVSIEGGHQKEPYIATSPRMFVIAKKVKDPVK